MSNEQTSARETAEAAAHDGLATLLERVADRIGLHAGVQAVFGAPLERGDVTVIPVAQVIIGTGVGGGASGDDESGSGAGGGAITRPLGFIEVDRDGAVFKPLRQPWQDAGLVVSFAFGLLLLAKAVRTLVRG